MSLRSKSPSYSVSRRRNTEPPTWTVGVPAVDYYSQGNSELATETRLIIKKLEARRKLTPRATRTVIALVGLPARGKSFVARKMQHYLNWGGVHCEIFNVGKYRRAAYAEVQRNHGNAASKGACDADFFDANNVQASELRQLAAEYALRDMLRWLDGETTSQSEDEHNSDEDEQKIVDLSRHSTVSTMSIQSTTIPGMAKLRDSTSQERIAIFDATNSTRQRREWILSECTDPQKRQGKQTGIVFVESICDDQELLEENYRYKVTTSPDFADMDPDQALQDLCKRVAKYEAQYESINEDRLSYIKIFNLSTKLMVNHIYGRMAKELVPALMAWHIGTRPVFLCRPGQTISGILTDGEDYVNRNTIDVSDPRFHDMSSKNRRRNLRGDTLGPNGAQFRDDLFDFIRDEALEFVRRRSSVRDMAYTGTSISGLAPGPSEFGKQVGTTIYETDEEECDVHVPMASSSNVREPFPLRIYTSTMPRAAETVGSKNWEDFQSFTQRSNLNPLDKGDYAGLELEEIRQLNPEWYEKLERDPFNTRFPGGESYRDLVQRLNSVVIDVEQQVVPTLVVSHVSILQCLMAYFRNTRVEKCMEIEVPLHTVIKYTPVRGGGWSESQHPLYDIPDGTKATLSRQGSSFGGMKQVESMSEMSQVTYDPSNNSESSPPIWEDSLIGPRSSLQSYFSHTKKSASCTISP